MHFNAPVVHPNTRFFLWASPSGAADALDMNSTTLTVHWHDENQPIYSVDFQKNGANGRLVTAGGDNNVRIWRLHTEGTTGGDQDPVAPTVEYLSTLSKHTQAVNVARFDPQGTVLATAGDDGTLIFWTKSNTIVKEYGNEDDDIQESWTVRHVCRTSTSEIYDIAWSPDLQYVAAGSMDNVTRIYRSVDGSQVGTIAEHGHYVQGVAWDPCGDFLATQLADRTVHIHTLTHLQPFSLKVVQKIGRADVPTLRAAQASFRLAQLYHSETLQSFFRRLAFSPDGSLLVTPLGIYREEVTTNETGTISSTNSTNYRSKAETTITAANPNPAENSTIEANTAEEYAQTAEANSNTGEAKAQAKACEQNKAKASAAETARNTGFAEATKASESEITESDSTETNTVYIFTRAGLHRPPVCHLPGLKKPAIAVQFSPIFYRRRSTNAVFALPYRMVFAVATQDSIVLYDTEQIEPLGLVSNLHYLTITDLCWSGDGKSVVVSSADGFCSLVTFEDLGEVHEKEQESEEK